MITVTLKKLTELGACRDGAEWFESQTKTDLAEVCHALIADNHAPWANWLIVRYMDKPQKVRYAIFAAEQVIDIFERKYPDDKRPRAAIDAAKKYLEDPSEENRQASRTYAAADDADAAAAADDAAAAAYAAAADDAADAADDAAAYAARREMQTRIIIYGLGLVGYNNGITHCEVDNA